MLWKCIEYIGNFLDTYDIIILHLISRSFNKRLKELKYIKKSI